MGFHCRSGYGGVDIKLKLGKDESADNDEASSDNKVSETKNVNSTNNTEEKKEDTENLRKIIKLGSTKEDPGDEEKTEEDTNQETKEKDEEGTKKNAENDTKVEQTVPESEDREQSEEKRSRDELEQRRSIMQNIKDFDFQIKKNQQDIAGLTEKISTLSKDLDDLVSLYEIVSEQMNPFVGLSKVTKKRLDSLENFMRDMDEMKTRIGDIESALEKNSYMLDHIGEGIGEQSSKVGKKEEELSNDDIDEILEASLSALLADQELDNVIDEFINNLKKK